MARLCAQLSRFIMSDEDDVDLSEEQCLRARERGLQAYLNVLLGVRPALVRWPQLRLTIN